MRKYLVLIALLFISMGAHAQVTWSAAGNAGAADAVTACKNAISWQKQPYVYATYKSDTLMWCAYSEHKDSYGYTVAANPHYADAVRSGACAAPKIISQTDGACINPPTCPYGQMMVQGTCAPIDCGEGMHYGRDPSQTALEIHRCVEDCPPTMIGSINPETHIQLCSPKAEPGEDKKTSENPTCPDTYEQIGFDGAGKAICRAGPETDPCPSGMHNVSADVSQPNCMSNAPSPTNTTTEKKLPETTKTNPDGSTEKTNEKETTFPDGSKLTERTVTTTNPDGSTSTTTTQKCSRDGGCGGAAQSGSGGGGGGGTGKGEGKEDNSVTAVAGDLYAKKSSKSVSDVLSGFSNSVGSGPAISAAKNFLSANVRGGSCPAWTASVPYLDMTIDVGQYFCSAFAADVIRVLGYGVLLVAAWLAFRIAFL